MRLIRTLPWLGALATVALFVTGVIFAQAAQLEAGGEFNGLWPIPFAAMACVGAFIAVRRPDNANGWLFLGAGFLMVTNGFAQTYANYSLTSGTVLPGTHFVAWLSIWSWMPGAALIALVLILFPTGHPRSPLWRWVVLAGYGLAAITVLLALPSLQGTSKALTDAPSPGAVPGGALLEILSIPEQLLLVVGFAAAVSRFVRARGVERLQMKWFVYGTSVLALATLGMTIVGIVFNIEDPIGNPIASGLVGLGILAIPVSAAVAILRYQLFDIDRIISRTLSYAILTVLLGGMFALVVLVPTAVIGSGKTPGWLVATGTLLAFGLFRPARRRVQTAVDHRFNRSRFDAAQTMDAFAARLREQVDLEALTDELRTVVARTMQPTSASVWLVPREDI